MILNSNLGAIKTIEPDKCDILYCVNGYNKDATTFRYTQDSRRKETKSKKYNKLILEFKKEKIDGKTVIEYETKHKNIIYIVILLYCCLIICRHFMQNITLYI